MQRGCSAASSNDSTHLLTSSNPLTLEDELESTMETDVLVVDGTCSGNSDKEDWHEAAYVLRIKEKYLLTQVAVDEVLSCTRQLVSDILSGVMNKVQGTLPSNAMNVIENEVSQINSSLFKRVATASMQKKYFKELFDLVVGDDCSNELASYVL